MQYIDMPAVKFADPAKQALFDEIRRRMRLADVQPYIRTDKGLERIESVGLGEELFEGYSENWAYYDRICNWAIEAGLALVSGVEVVRRGRPRSRS